MPQYRRNCQPAWAYSSRVSWEGSASWGRVGHRRYRRSGLGASYLVDCTAQMAGDGSWTYEVGSHATA